MVSEDPHSADRGEWTEADVGSTQTHKKTFVKYLRELEEAES